MGIDRGHRGASKSTFPRNKGHRWGHRWGIEETQGIMGIEPGEVHYFKILKRFPDGTSWSKGHVVVNTSRILPRRLSMYIAGVRSRQLNPLPTAHSPPCIPARPLPPLSPLAPLRPTPMHASLPLPPPTLRALFLCFQCVSNRKSISPRSVPDRGEILLPI